MSSPEYIETASLVLGNCRSHDPMFAKASDSMILAWARVFEKSGMSRDDILAGVDHAYDNADEGFRPLAATIIKHAQAAYFEALKELSDERRKLMEEANYALQDMGYTPNEAHRYSRAIALSRQSDLTLTPEQDAELRQAIASAREKLAEPPRQLESLWSILPARRSGRDPQRAFGAPEPRTRDQDDAA